MNTPDRDYTVEFWLGGKHVISFHVKANSTLSAHEYGLGKLADINVDRRNCEEPMLVHNETRILQGVI